MAPQRRDIVGAAVVSALTADITSGSTSIGLTVTTGWPTGSVGPFFVAIDAGKANEEKILVLSRTGNTLTVVTTPSSGRGADNTTAVTHSAGAEVKVVGTATDLREANEHIMDVEADPHATKLLNNARHDVTARHTAGTVVPTAAPSATSLPSDATAEGVATTTARSDHRHPREGYGSPAASGVADTASNGTATTVARADHRHAREGFGAPAASAVGDAAVTGTATTTVHSDHKHAREAFGAPAASAVGDAAVTGVAVTVPHSDHKHAREAFAAPVAVGGANAAGSATTIPRSDHVHAPQPVMDARVFNSGAISIPNNVETALTFDSELYDTDALHSTASLTSRFTVPAGGGRFCLGGSIEFAANPTGDRHLAIKVNGIAYYVVADSRLACATLPTRLSVATEFSFSAGDFVELVAYQNSGISLNIVRSSEYSPSFWIARV